MDTQYIKRPTDRAAWLDARKGFVGGSEVAALCGVKSFKTPAEIYADKTGLATETVDESDLDATLALRLGQYMEPFIAHEYTLRTGRETQNYGYMIAKGHALADIDRLVVPDGEKVASFHAEIRTSLILEIKTTRNGELFADGVPNNYEAQVQQYLELSGASACDVAVLIYAPRLAFRIFRVERDTRVGGELLRRIEMFWREHVEAGVAPPVNGLDDARMLFPRGGGEAVEADPDTAGRIRALRQTEADIKQLTAHADKLRGEIAAAMGDADALTVDGKTVCTFRAPKPTDKIDFKGAFQDLALALHADAMQTAGIISKHRTLVNGARRFLLKAEKPEP